MGLSARINLEMMHSIITGYLAICKCNYDAKFTALGGEWPENAPGLDKYHH
jgi:hypothetical protein